MLGALAPARRRVLLAHEHALAYTAVTVAVAANPVGTTVAFLVERWNDEQAATAVGDRTVTARAWLGPSSSPTARARPVF
ncbi:hypothetical protein AV521_15185 [Streptomyces sp. IMTB 2501]|uniref:hypothetical protein n=1 Tax=Streptomyces sp. IMTB 2501 TaxID=1776340 RepID=UPI00096CBA7A|nr:hypothetical protein [Streptomyces sp. IMTB 2501]OLZ70469.1 hypothetical protein AV521_15185 [Streptomyces sp. IMTB 2501]